MPIYEYECPKCGRFEVVQKFDDKPLKCDPECKDKKCPKKAQRIMSAAAFHLKGTGWYKTDYATKPAPVSDSDKSSTKSESKSESKAAPETSSSSESKKAAGSSDKSSGGTGGSGGSSGGCGSGCGCH